jgi:hypothetical protein
MSWLSSLVHEGCNVLMAWLLILSVALQVGCSSVLRTSEPC